MLLAPDWPSPKLSVAEKRAHFFPYYAGYSEIFVKRVINEFGLPPNSRVLDPWCGSGTTTLVCGINGLRGVGVDLNPVAITISEARTANLRHVEIASDLCFARRFLPLPTRVEVFEFFKSLFVVFRDSAARLPERDRKKVLALVTSAIFVSIHRLYKKSRASNPVWFVSSGPKWRPQDELYEQFLTDFDFVIRVQVGNALKIKVSPTHHCVDFAMWPSRRSRFDAVISSPPYLTRIDYIMAVLPQMMYLKLLNGADIDQLRKNMLGSPLTAGAENKLFETAGPQVRQLIDLVTAHQSKASSTYYRRFFVSYFNRLHKSLLKAADVLLPGAPLALVVQSSWYKEIYIDLATLVREISLSANFESMGEREFAVIRNMQCVNKYSKTYDRDRPVLESAIFLRRT